jgi:cell division protein ZapA (FtsZ GTPase activity inhibitor)
MDKKPVSNIIKGLIIAAILIVLDLLGSTSFFKSASWFTYLPTITLVVLCILNVIHYCNELKGNVKFGDAFAFGFKTAAIVALVMVLYTFISLKYVHPEFKKKHTRKH